MANRHLNKAWIEERDAKIKKVKAKKEKPKKSSKKKEK